MYVTHRWELIVSAVTVVGDEVSRWEDVERKGWLAFQFLGTESKLKETRTKQACEHRSMTNHIKSKTSPIYLCRAALNT